MLRKERQEVTNYRLMETGRIAQCIGYLYLSVDIINGGREPLLSWFT
jgi:hypothetical protein